MRVTNSMVFGNSMNNIWRSTRHLNNLVTQLETTKRFQRPSDDPMSAARSLRYRTILSEAEQFIRNVNSGLAWMEVSEASFNNLLTGTPANPSLMERINNRLIQGANADNTIDEQKAIMEEIRQYFQQMFGVEINQTYMGRYVFSGFHTDRPPVLKQDLPGSEFIIRQTFNTRDIETVLAYHRPTPSSLPEQIPGVNIIKLPFSGVSFDPANSITGVPNMDDVHVRVFSPHPEPNGTIFNVIERGSGDPDAYRPEDFSETEGFAQGAANPVIHFIRDTGELVLSGAAKEAFRDGVEVTYVKRELQAGDLSPAVYFNSWDITQDPPVNFNTAGQDIELEVSANSHVVINSHARDVLTANLFADLRRLINFTDSLVATDPTVVRAHYIGEGLTGADLDDAVERFEIRERQAFADMMFNRIENMMELHARHINQTTRELTDLGTRMDRLDMIHIRLEEDEINYTSLLSENEDTDIPGTIVRKAGAEAAFQNALNAIARVTQLSLADFINR